jgi:hypothetical protein
MNIPRDHQENRMARRRSLSLLILLCVVAIGQPTPAQEPPAVMNGIAERYVRLVLALGRHDADYVDAYYGPPEWRTASAATPVSLERIGTDAGELLADLARAPAADDALGELRREYLRGQLEALGSRVRILSGSTLAFDDESRALYDAVAPRLPESYFEETLDALDRRLPGSGSVADRIEQFRSAFVIPRARLGAVFDAAIAECRARTAGHVELPPDERFTVEYVTDRSWSGYNWYQGGFQSLIQVNTDLPIYIDRAIDLACHEGYPGHHVYNVLLERHLVRERGWVEFSVYPLFSPQSLIAEGTANYGIDVAFPDDERLSFERDVLFPAAGLDGARAREYYEIQALAGQLEYAGNEAARKYLNGEIDRPAAAAWLTRFALMAPARAEQRTRFFDQYRSYVINYNLGKDLVKQFVESQADGDAATRWDAFLGLLASPRLPSGLEVTDAP